MTLDAVPQWTLTTDPDTVATLTDLLADMLGQEVTQAQTVALIAQLRARDLDVVPSPPF